MDLKQIKDDLKEGKIVSKVTWMKLLEAAIIQNEALNSIVYGDGHEFESQIASKALNEVFEL